MFQGLQNPEKLFEGFLFYLSPFCNQDIRMVKIFCGFNNFPGSQEVKPKKRKVPNQRKVPKY